MKTNQYWIAWIYMFALCAVLGFLPEPTGGLRWIFMAIGLAFFVPGIVLAYKADVRDRMEVIRQIKWVSIIALSVDVVLICANIASTLLPDAWGIVLQWMLNIFASPMGCGQSPALTMFGWAFVMVYCFYLEKKER